MSDILTIVRSYCAPDSRVEKETATLSKAGFKVETFCLWHQGLQKTEEWEGGTLRRILNVPVKKGRKNWMKILSVFLFSIYTLWYGRRFDIVHCNDLDMLPIGVLLKWSSLGRIKVVYDAHEYETEKFSQEGLKKRLAQILEKCFIRFADKTITVSEAIADEYKKLYKTIERPQVILNCPPMKDIPDTNLLRQHLNISKEKILFLYQGGLFPNRGIEMIVDAFTNVQDKNKVIVFMGFGPLEEMIKNNSLDEPNIYFQEAVSSKVLHDYTASADVGIIYYENTCLNHYYCSPNKLFEYIMAGLPIIASDLYELRRILTENQNGTVVPNGDSKALAKVIEDYDERLIEQQRINAITLREQYCWEHQEKILLDLYRDITVTS